MGSTSIPAPGIPLTHKIEDTGVSVSVQFWTFSCFKIQSPLPGYSLLISQKESWSPLVDFTPEIHSIASRYFRRDSASSCFPSLSIYIDLSHWYCWIWRKISWLSSWYCWIWWRICWLSFWYCLKWSRDACLSISSLWRCRLSRIWLNRVPKSFQTERKTWRQTVPT